MQHDALCGGARGCTRAACVATIHFGRGRVRASATWRRLAGRATGARDTSKSVTDAGRALAKSVTEELPDMRRTTERLRAQAPRRFRALPRPSPRLNPTVRSLVWKNKG